MRQGAESGPGGQVTRRGWRAPGRSFARAVRMRTVGALGRQRDA